MANTDKVESLQRKLEAQLIGGENLLAFTQAALPSNTVGSWRSQTQYGFGLTPKRLIVMPLGDGKPATSIGRQYVKAITTKATSFLSAKLEIKLPDDTLSGFMNDSTWKKRAKELAAAESSEPTPASLSLAPPSDVLVDQVKAFQALGLIRSAQAILAQAIRSNPGLDMDPAIGPLSRNLDEERLSLRVVAGFIAGELLISLLPVIVFGVNPDAGIYVLMSFAFGTYILGRFVYQLWGGHVGGRQHARALAILAFLFTGLSLFGQPDLLEVIRQVSFGGALILVLTGSASRQRTYLGTAVYGLGYLGATAFEWFRLLFPYFFG